MLVSKVLNEVKAHFKDQEGSHDWFHIERVWKMSILLHQKEGGDKEVIELCALLHDISDHKYNGGDFEKGGQVAKEWILKCGGTSRIANRVAALIPGISYKGAEVTEDALPIEGLIVRDADRLDAIGAMGIARAFAYGGSRKRPLYNPSIKPVMHTSKEQYLNSKTHTVNHFYEKLLLLKELLQTEAAKDIAKERHEFMKLLLDQFYKEWNVEP